MAEEAPSPAPSPESMLPFGSWRALLIIIVAVVVILVATGNLDMGMIAPVFPEVFGDDMSTVLSYFGIGVGAALGVIVLGIIFYYVVVGKIRHHYRFKRSLTTVIFTVAMPKENEILADAAEAMYSGLYSVFKGKGPIVRLKRFFQGQEQFSFEVVGQQNKITLYIAVPSSLESLVERQIYGQYADAEIQKVEDHNIFFPGSTATFTELKKFKQAAYPIRVYRDFVKEEGTRELKALTIDTLSAVTNAMTKLDENEGAMVQILVRPTGAKWQKQGNKEIKKIHSKTKSSKEAAGEQLTSAETEKIRTLEQSISRPGFETVVRLVTTAPLESRATMHKNNILSAFAQFNTVEYNKLVAKKRISTKYVFQDVVNRWFPLFQNPKFFKRWDMPWFGRISVFNSAELATLFHLPNKHIDTPHLTWVRAKKAPSPQNVPKFQPKEGGCRLGFNSYRGVVSEVWIRRDDRRRHIYSIGKTGMGKSCLAENMIIQDIINGEGCCYMDPHGDAIDTILTMIPEHRMDDVVVFDPSDSDRPIGLNMIEFENADQKDFVVGEFIAILYKLFAEFIGPRFEHIVRNSLLAIMDNPDGGTLVEMMRIITDEDYKDECLQYVTNPLVKAFWLEEMAQQVDFHKSEMLGPVLSKFGRFVSNDMMRNIIGQTKSGINVRKIMDEKKILLINLSKGKIGDMNCNLLGMIFVSKILMSSLSRVDTPEEDRHDFYLYVDEFQNFSTDSFATILSEARKYRLNLYITHQYIGQLEDKIQKAVFGNVGTMMFMRVGAPDAEMVAKELKPTFDEADVINVDKYSLYTKLLVDGVATKPFSLHTYAPYKSKQNLAAEIKHRCRMKYGRDRKEVEAEIRYRAKLDTLDVL
ncbi:MAG: TraM recognition domain-containing protein [bacterium]